MARYGDDQVRRALEQLADAARPYLDVTAPCDEFSAEPGRRYFEALSAAMAIAERALAGQFDT